MVGTSELWNSTPSPSASLAVKREALAYDSMSNSLVKNVRFPSKSGGGRLKGATF